MHWDVSQNTALLDTDNKWEQETRPVRQGYVGRGETWQKELVYAEVKGMIGILRPSGCRGSTPDMELKL